MAAFTSAGSAWTTAANNKTVTATKGTIMRLLTVIAALVTCLALVSSASAASAKKPSLTLVSASPVVGGTIVLAYDLKQPLALSDGLWVTVSCDQSRSLVFRETVSVFAAAGSVSFVLADGRWDVGASASCVAWLGFAPDGVRAKQVAYAFFEVAGG